MDKKIFINIEKLYGVTTPGIRLKSGEEMKNFAMIPHAYLMVGGGKILAFGPMETLNREELLKTPEVIDCRGKYILPSFVDSHTHLVFAASREEEFVMRIKGTSYEEIAKAGGGILNSAKKLATMSEEDLYQEAHHRLKEVIRSGTGAIEIKSGYGLTTESELKMLRVIKRLKQDMLIPVRATFLGAHAYPAEFMHDHQGYIDMIKKEMLPEIAANKLADYIDVFCDRGFFSMEETDDLLQEAAKYGLKAKIHGNELGLTGGVQAAVKNNAVSVDHLEHLSFEEIALLKESSTFPVALPNCSFFLRLPYAPVREMIDQGLPVVLASDYNPGSSPSGNMRFVVSLACTQMKLLPEEAFNATTLNGAAALEWSDSIGSIEEGKLANFILTKNIPSLAYIPYAFGSDWITEVYVHGTAFKK